MLRLTGSLGWMFAALALGLGFYGLIMTVSIGSGAWFKPVRSAPAPVPLRKAA
jgi:hypothetical protein